MLELVQETKNLDFNPKLNIFDPGIQIMNLSKISEVGSVSNAKDLIPYWNLSCRELSEKWLSHTKIDCVDLDSISYPQLQVDTIADSWFSTKVVSPLKMNSLKTYFPLFTFSPADFTDSENTVVRSRKIRIYPKDKELMKKYFGISRYWYNKAIEHLKTPGTKASFYDIRENLQTEPTPEWVEIYPKRIKDHAIDDACKAVRNVKKKYLKVGEIQKLKFRTKKDRNQTFGFDKQSISDLFIFSPKYRINFYPSESVVPELEGTRITYEDGRYFLILPCLKQIKIPENQRFNLVALDPGVRTFITFYTPEVQGKIGENDFKKIYRLCLGLDKLYSKISKAKCKQKRNMRKAAGRLRWKIYNLIEDLHKKTAYFLVTRFNTILIPKFKISKMVTKLKSKVSRSMLTFAHFRFKEFLKSKAEEYSCKVLEVSEAYTSKTCSYCGRIQNIGSKKVMKCSCGVIEDRDINGARGILLRALTVTSPQVTVGNC